MTLYKKSDKEGEYVAAPNYRMQYSHCETEKWTKFWRFL